MTILDPSFYHFFTYPKPIQRTEIIIGRLADNFMKNIGR